MPVLTVTDAAASRFLSVLRSDSREHALIRLSVREVGVHFDYRFEIATRGELRADDVLIHANGVDFCADAESTPRVAGATIDYVDTLATRGFSFQNPNRTRLAGDPLAVGVQALIDERINPELAQHSGHVYLADIRERRVFLIFGGGCQGCRQAGATLRKGIADRLMAEFPEIAEIVDATHHEEGTHPYYAS
jgi:Fe/S biogenesis protein NfuA